MLSFCIGSLFSSVANFVLVAVNSSPGCRCSFDLGPPNPLPHDLAYVDASLTVKWICYYGWGLLASEGPWQFTWDSVIFANDVYYYGWGLLISEVHGSSLWDSVTFANDALSCLKVHGGSLWNSVIFANDVLSCR